MFVSPLPDNNSSQGLQVAVSIPLPYLDYNADSILPKLVPLTPGAIFPASFGLLHRVQEFQVLGEAGLCGVTLDWVLPASHRGQTLEKESRMSTSSGSRLYKQKK